MKTSKLFAALLAILGFQVQSCTKEDDGNNGGSSEEYGCPYTTFSTNGTVQDENGNKIEGAEVNVNINVIIERQDSTGTTRNDTIDHLSNSSFSNKKGNYEVAIGGNPYQATLNYEVITNKDGYEPDTVRKEVQSKDLEQVKEGKWGTTIKNKIDIVLKKK